jgi:hypothetical protein
MKDGTVKLALAICIQNGKLSYVNTEGAGAEIQLESVNLQATRRANARPGFRNPFANSSTR